MVENDFCVDHREDPVGTGVGDGLRKIVGVFPAIASKYAVPNSVAGSTLVPSDHSFHVVISCHVAPLAFIFRISLVNRFISCSNLGLDSFHR